MPITTEAPTTDENGDETHPSWTLIRASKLQSTGTPLFDSEIVHNQFVRITAVPATRQRRSGTDRLYGEREPIVQIDMSMAQWGAFVSSFGDGNGVPATLNVVQGADIAHAPHDPRLGLSVDEVRGAADEAVEKISVATNAVREAFDEKAGRKVMAGKLRDLEIALGNIPANMAYAAQTLVEHTENVVTKAKADIEATVAGAQVGPALGSGSAPAVPAIETGVHAEIQR